MADERAVIIGAGPAGLTAALELLERTTLRPIVLEASGQVGGLSRTVEFEGSRMDVGGHRFFTKSDRVLDWWLHIFPLQALPPGPYPQFLLRPLASLDQQAPDPDRSDRVMLLRERRSRIYYRRRFFDYPLRLNPQTFAQLGLGTAARISLSYLKSVAFPIAPERSLEDLYVNRFGRELYRSFFRGYTEKVMGLSPAQISAEWGRERTRGLSVSHAVRHFARGLLPRAIDLGQQHVETSLVEQFLYPKLGPGHFWEEVARRVTRLGGTVKLGQRVVGLDHDGGRVTAVHAEDRATGERQAYPCDVALSTMPLGDLVDALGPSVPDSVRAIAQGLPHRAFISVGMLVSALDVPDGAGRGAASEPIRDNWIYVQEPGIRMGRLQIFNNWSPYLVADETTTCIGLEYFCAEGDDLWRRSDDEMMRFGARELQGIGFLQPQNVLSHKVVRVRKAYPVYAGTHDRLQVIRDYLEPLENLFVLGRNGMHRYNNQDHSMLTALSAVDNILAGTTDKSNLWQVDAEA
ncbi:MAG: NAD(P)/FAD-dependent oxidoreductase [Deltaproteobacteria bacterium]|jgi:protoporphyrinogen oxidase|nr:NAD(P)/FAD-dependent oxidoreductase [Deltaproteobacteria bacterium]MBW2531631.1 NAD(P)/FAD-dependent oxidoreductase [Deltaproteobacteria bacterium]